MSRTATSVEWVRQWIDSDDVTAPVLSKSVGVTVSRSQWNALLLDHRFLSYDCVMDGYRRGEWRGIPVRTKDVKEYHG